MKIFGIRVARSVWFMPSYFLNPKGISFRPILGAMKSRYQFLSTPLDSPPNTQQSDGIKFENGVFKTNDMEIQISNLSIFDDGIVINTRSSTEHADLFMEDVIDWANKEFGLPTLSELPARRAYLSEVNIAFENDPKIFSPKFIKFFNNLSAAMSDEIKGEVGFFSLNIGTDQLRSNEPTIFKIDREINTANSENRFWCSAPIRTEIHLNLLQEMERLAS